MVTRAPIIFSVLSTLLIAPLFCESVDSNFESALMYLFAGEFGYTLIGEKAISLDESQNRYMHTHPDESNKLLVFLERLFRNSDAFVFKVFLYEHNCNRIELINKRAVLSLIETDRRLKRFVKEKFTSESRFIDELMMPDRSVFDLFDNDAFLIGIALGYGVSNSDYFCRRSEVGRYLKKYPLVCFLPFNPKPRPGAAVPNRFHGFFEPRKVVPPKRKKHFLSLSDEWEWIKKMRWDIWQTSRPRPPYYVALPFYICRHGGDSEEVMARYVSARDKLADLFCGRKFSEVIAEEAAKK